MTNGQVKNSFYLGIGNLGFGISTLDAAYGLKKARENISRFQETIHQKMLERGKLQEEVREIEARLREIRALEHDIVLKRSLLGRLDLELTRLRMQKLRLEREIPQTERELEGIERERRFGRMMK